MIDGIRAALDFFTSVSQFATNMILGLFNLLNHIPTYISFLSVSIGLLPAMLIPFAIASISIYGVLFLLNREG